MDPAGFFLTEGFSVLFADRLDAVEGNSWTLADVTIAQAGDFQAAGCNVTDDVFVRVTTALADRYRIERTLGSAGTATVYLAPAPRAARLEHPRPPSA